MLRFLSIAVVACPLLITGCDGSNTADSGKPPLAPPSADPDVKANLPVAKSRGTPQLKVAKPIDTTKQVD